MPTDLSRVGLEGLESFSARKSQEANANYMSELAAQSQYTREEEIRINDIARKAVNNLATGERGQAASIDVDGAAEQMGSMAEPIEAIGNALVRAGVAKQGTEALVKASEIRKRESDMRGDVFLNEQRRLENIQKGAAIVASTIGVAQNQAEYEQGLKDLRNAGVMDEEQMRMLESQPFDPRVSAYYRERAISAGDQATLEMRRLELDESTRAHNDTQTDRIQRLALQEARDKSQKQYREHLMKNSGANGTGTNIPTDVEVGQVKSVLQGDVFSGVDMTDELNKTELASAAVSIASKAKALIRDNKALTWETAVNRAIIDAQSKGAFETTEGTTGLMGYGKKPKRVDFKQLGNSPEMAMALPAKKTEMKKGKYYITAHGRAKWNGTAFELAE